MNKTLGILALIMWIVLFVILAAGIVQPTLFSSLVMCGVLIYTIIVDLLRND